MPRNTLFRIRRKVHQREYDMSAHAMEEMADDGRTPVGVVGRFTPNDRYLVITVYEANQNA